MHLKLIDTLADVPNKQEITETILEETILERVSGRAS